MTRDWHENEDLPWCKLWMGWWTSPSHLELDAGQLGIGLAMLMLANARGRRGDGSGAVCSVSGRPMTAEAIGRFAHATPEQVRDTIDALRAVGTVEVEDDGCVVFPNLQDYQETADARRKRGDRKKARSGPSKPASPAPEETEPPSTAEEPASIAEPTEPPPSEVASQPEAHAGGGLDEASTSCDEDSPPDSPRTFLGLFSECPRTVRGHSAQEDQKIRGSEDPPPKPPSRGDSRTKRKPRPPDKPKAKRAEWFLAEAEALGRLPDVERVVGALLRHHDKARPKSLHRGLIAERLIADEFSVAELVEAVDGYCGDDWYRSRGKSADLGYVMRDADNVEAGRAKLTAAAPSSANEPQFEVFRAS